MGQRQIWNTNAKERNARGLPNNKSRYSCSKECKCEDGTKILKEMFLKLKIAHQITVSQWLQNILYKQSVDQLK